MIMIRSDFSLKHISSVIIKIKLSYAKGKDLLSVSVVRLYNP